MIRYKRLDLSKLEYECLIKSIDFEKLEAFDKTYKEIEGFNTVSKVNNPKDIKFSAAKNTASEKATKARSNKAKEKIQTAIDILRMSKQKITHYSIAQTCGVSFTTVKKYLDDDTLKSLNEME
jgi:response regulator of citrate/malate metabolism